MALHTVQVLDEYGVLVDSYQVDVVEGQLDSETADSAILKVAQELDQSRIKERP